MIFDLRVVLLFGAALRVVVLRVDVLRVVLRVVLLFGAALRVVVLRVVLLEVPFLDVAIGVPLASSLFNGYDQKD